MGKIRTALVIAACLSTWPAAAQETKDPASGNAAGGEDAGLGLKKPGLHLYSATAFGNYYSNGVPASFNSGPSGGLRSDIAYGGSLSMGWTRTGSRLSSSLNYSPSYNGRWRYSNLSSFGHRFNANFNLQVNPKWSVGLTATGTISDQQSSLFAPSNAAQLAAAPSNFNSLSSALTTGQASNPQLGAVLASPLMNSPASTILYGSRFFAGALSANVRYSHSDRLNISAGVDGNHTQSLSQSSASGLTAPVPIVPRSIAIGVRASVFYGLTPRLSLTGNWNGQRNLQYQQAYGNTFIHNSTATLSYLVGQKWVFTGGAGIGYRPPTPSRSSTSTVQAQRGIHYLWTGSVAYKFYSQSLIARASRSVTNMYGLGGATTLAGDLGWNWNRPGSSWGMAIDGGYQSFTNPQSTAARILSPTIGGWRGTASLHRMLSRRLSCSAAYTLFRSTGIYSNVNYGVSRGSVQVSLSWSFADLMGPFGQ